MSAFRIPSLIALTFLAIAASVPQSAAAQEPDDPPGLNLLDQLGGPGGFGGDLGFNQAEVAFSGEYRLAEGTRDGFLDIKVEVTPTWHIYSVTQLPGGPQRTVISVAESSDFEVVGAFRPDRAPHVENYEFFSVPVEEHDGQFTWSAPIRLNEDATEDGLVIDVTLNGQVCQDDGVCLPISDKAVDVVFAGYFEPEAPSGEYRNEGDHIAIRGTLQPTATQPGATVKLALTAAPDDGWHIYDYAAKDPEVISKPTLIVIDGDWKASKPLASSQPKEEETGIEDEPIIRYHEEPVTWLVDIQVPDDVRPGEYEISGAIGYQVCTSSNCDLPQAATFVGRVIVGGDELTGSNKLTFADASYSDVAKLAASRDESAAQVAGADAENTATAESAPRLDLANIQAETPNQDTPMAVVLLTAFAAGFILNFMPCVLPVIGLKVMSFVQQAGDNRSRVFVLNLWYSAGLMSVFLILATLAVFMGLGWGQQFSSATFNIVLASVVFAFALSFLGVWEIPLPGFVGSGAVGDLATKEGASGAFFKGVLTTVLATPCSGPMLTPALTWAVSQTPAVAYAGFACVGLGMASPYLLIGAFPKLVSFLPKPGAWMDTFKHIMGFVLLGTVVFLLTFIDIPYVVPALAFMVGLWAALWWIGRVPLTETFDKKSAAWVGGGAFAIVIGLFVFGAPFGPFRENNLLMVMESRFQKAVDRELAVRNVAVEAPAIRAGDDSPELAWRPFSLDLLGKLTAENRTVFVDFTADW